MTSKQLHLEQALHCAKCGQQATFVEEHCSQDFAEGEIVLITCRNSHCRERPSFYCKSCQIKCYLNGLNRHAASRRHQEKHAIKYPTPVVPPEPDCHSMILASKLNDDSDEFANTTTTPDDGDYNSMEICQKPLTDALRPASDGPEGTRKNGYPVIQKDGNEWLELALKDLPFATEKDLFVAFGAPEVLHMKNFWVAELASGQGRCGGGLSYLAGRAFQQVKDSQLDYNRLPDCEESKWQFNNLIQYQSLNEKQRLRQASLHKTFLKSFSTDVFFKHTFLPHYNQLGRYYGSSGQHSMFNNLPCPRSIDVDGVAYASPKACVAFLMASGIPIDDVIVTATTPDTSIPDHLRRVHNVDESQKAMDWFRQIQHDYYGSKNGAPEIDSNSGAPKHPAVVCLHLSDWKDGFDSAKVKSNRNAIDSKTFTISPPKSRINGTENTFAVALGLKKAKGWRKVEAMFRKELDELTNAREPIMLYHGVLQKMVPCFFKEFAVLSDKQERNYLTGTLGCGSNIHRCFGVSSSVQTASCKLHELKDFLSKERLGQAQATFGWTCEYLDSRRNGADLPSCKSCRTQAIRKLLGLDPGRVRNCNVCANWNLLDNSLHFVPHKDYPTSAAEGCPVPAPEGRNIFQEDNLIPNMQITWDLMKDASRFAFFQASRPKGHWLKSSTTAYLKHCGIAGAFTDQLYAAARKCAKAKQQDNIDYFCPSGIGEFVFHPAWKSKSVNMQDFIEAVMHQLFLGAAESNYDLIAMWLASTDSSAKLGHASFLNVLQELLKDLRGFHLSWLLAYPMTGKKGSLGTGSWVAENWVCLVRISQFVFGWCRRNPDIASKYGVDDMSRMVIAYHAFVARCLTHSGITKNSIAEAELYMKEFLSALRELDVRVRHQKLNKPVQKASEKKGTEAWFLKPNYMSLPNLLDMMRVIGPLVLWWDGGGKGERFIQFVKPYIKRGVREDAISFFVNLLDKLFQMRSLDLLEARYGLSGDGNNKPAAEDLNTFSEVFERIVEDILLDQDSNGLSSEEEEEEDGSTSEEEDFEEETNAGIFDETYFSTNEAHGMTKTKTIYVYRNSEQLNEGILSKKPLAGYVEVNISSDGKKAFEFFTVHRKPVKQFARRRVVFDDKEGLSFHGMWCAKIKVEEEKVPLTSDFTEIQGAAKLSAVALPLWYIIGKNHPDSDKFCVITNWWRYRMSDGTYKLPSLDPELYQSISDEELLAQASTKGSSTVTHGFV